METLAAGSHAELTALLGKIDISVPPRGDPDDKRTSRHVERWSMCRFLATYGHTRFVRYPLLVEKTERPDYRMSSCDRLIGVEITEAVSEDLARADAMRQRRDGIIPLDVSLFRPGVPKRSAAELRAILDASTFIESDGDDEDDDERWERPARAMGPGWAGDGGERDWAGALFEVINSKSASARKPGYTYHDETWLLVYDNLSIPMLDVPRAMHYLKSKLAPVWADSPFKHVFIEHRSRFIRVSDTVHETKELVDLWKN